MEVYMNFTEFIIQVPKYPTIGQDFISGLKSINTINELKLLLKKFEIKTQKDELEKIFDNKNRITKLDAKSIEPLY